MCLYGQINEVKVSFDKFRRVFCCRWHNLVLVAQSFPSLLLRVERKSVHITLHGQNSVCAPVCLCVHVGVPKFEIICSLKI